MLGGSALLEVKSSENGVFAKFLLDFQLNLLHASLLILARLFFLFLLGQRLVIGKQVKLYRLFFDILEYLKEGDCLVLNDSKVIPARLFGRKALKDAVKGDSYRQ